MKGDRKAHSAQLRAIEVYRKKPGKAKEAHKGAAALGDGLTCRYEQDGHSIVIDMPEAIGGDDNGPSPGFFGRAALTSCIGIGIKMAATRDNLALKQVVVHIDQAFDSRGLLEMGAVTAGPTSTAITIDIVSDEADDTINSMLNRALAHDPWLSAFREAQEVSIHTRRVNEVN